MCVSSISSIQTCSQKESRTIKTKCFLIIRTILSRRAQAHTKSRPIWDELSGQTFGIVYIRVPHANGPNSLVGEHIAVRFLHKKQL